MCFEVDVEKDEDKHEDKHEEKHEDKHEDKHEHMDWVWTWRASSSRRRAHMQAALFGVFVFPPPAT